MESKMPNSENEKYPTAQKSANKSIKKGYKNRLNIMSAGKLDTETESLETDSNLDANISPEEPPLLENPSFDNEVSNSIIIKKKSKSKISKKYEHDNRKISVKTSFSKFDDLQKLNLINSQENGNEMNCRQCKKVVYKMEEVIVQSKFDKGIYHKSCMRCKDCSKQLKFDNYHSHEGILYCMVHFKKLFAPKTVEDVEEVKLSRTELIIRESEPAALPPDVVRASDKPNLGLDELHQLNVLSRFQVFENIEEQKLKEEQMRLQRRPIINRNSSLLSRCHINNDDTDLFADESKENEDQDSADADLICSKRCTQKERPLGIGDAINDIKTIFEFGQTQLKEDRREERKQEIQNIRSRLFLGKQAKIKEMYQQAVADSGQMMTSVGKRTDIEIGKDAQSIKHKFETGEMFNHNSEEAQPLNGNGYSSGLSEDADVFESGIGKKSRSIFMELDANVACRTSCNPEIERKRSNTQSKQANYNQLAQRNLDSDMVKSETKLENVKVPTAELTEKFKFFETYRSDNNNRRQFRITPPREGVVKVPTPDRDTEKSDLDKQKPQFCDNVLQITQTTSTILNKFREMEKDKNRPSEPKAPKPLKCFTPPPEDERRYSDDLSNSEEDSDNESDVSKDVLDLGPRNGDEALKEAQSAARAKVLRAKFEKWETNEIKQELNGGYVDIYSQAVSDESTIESAKTIRERFENIKNFEPKSLGRPNYQVNRFVVSIQHINNLGIVLNWKKTKEKR